MTKDNPTYSICICNYNMEDTIERALESIISQLDKTYEVVIADDGSSDDSVKIIKQMQERYDILRLIELKRDRKRKLGFTRNIAIEEARGDYVLLHLDCDDIYAPYLKDVVAAFHQIEEAMGQDLLLSGQHINIGKKDFLLSHGPYENIFRGEDRNLWTRLASIGAYVPFDHVDFCTRLPKPAKQRYMRAVMYTWDHMENDFRSHMSLWTWLAYELHKGKIAWGWKYRVMRMCVAPLAFATAKMKGRFAPPPENMNTPEKFAEYREKTRGKLSEILGRYNKSVDWSVISPEAKHIFE